MRKTFAATIIPLSSSESWLVVLPQQPFVSLANILVLGIRIEGQSLVLLAIVQLSREYFAALKVCL